MPQNPKQTMLLNLILLALMGYAVVLATLEGMAMQSADLFAMWLAGEFMAMGQLDQIYPANTDIFDMTAPSAWWPHVEAIDPDWRVFPYIYPPIWAKLVSWLTPVTTFGAFDVAFLALHQILLIATTYLAAKMCGLRGTAALMMMSLTYAVMVLTMPIGIAVGENQPQILVSFLIVFAFERAQFGAPRAAGTFLALAAAIKVYPLLFLVIFLARRNWQAVTSFVIAGAALGSTSIALTGWALHAEYLALLGVVSKSVIVSSFSFSADAFVAGTAFKQHLIYVSQPSQTAEALGWAAIAKGPIWSGISAVAQILGIIAVGVLAARKRDEVLILPFAAALFAFLSPLSWAYTYLPVFVFIAILPLRLGAWGWGIALAMAAFFHPLAANITLSGVSLGGSSFGLGGIALTVLMLVAMLAGVLIGNGRGKAPIPRTTAPAT